MEIDFEIEEDAVVLDGVVVSANRSETTRQLAPTLVNVLNIETKCFSTVCKGSENRLTIKQLLISVFGCW